jgi:hypothetical protein
VEELFCRSYSKSCPQNIDQVSQLSSKSHYFFFGRWEEEGLVSKLAFEKKTGSLLGSK